MSKPANQWLHAHVTASKSRWFWAGCCIALSSLSYVGFAHYSSAYIGYWLKGNEISCWFLLFAGAALLLRFSFAALAGWQADLEGFSIIQKMKSDAINALFSQHHLEPNTAANYVSNLPDKARPYFSQFVFYAMASVIVSTIMLMAFFYTDKVVFVMLLLSLLLIPVQMISVGYGAESIHEKHIHLFLQYASIFQNRLKALAGLQQLGVVPQQKEFLSQKSNELNHATQKVMKIAMLSSSLMEFFITFSIALVAIYLGLSLLGYMPEYFGKKGYDFQKSLFLLMLVPYYYFYLRKFVSAYHDRNRAIAVAETLFPIFNNAPKENNIENNVQDEITEGIRFQNVSFRYRSDGLWVLHELNFELPAKGLVLVKGISGSGKSTLLKLLAGYLQPNDGNICIHTGNEQASDWLKRHSVYMNQFPFLFDGTIADNIQLATPLDKETFQQILTTSQLTEILPKETSVTETVLSHNGIQLSGGQKQLVSFARLLAHLKPIVILDEPTANLDEETSYKIAKQIEALSQSHLVMVASHDAVFQPMALQQINLNRGQQEYENE